MSKVFPASCSWRHALTCVMFLEVLTCHPRESAGQVRSCTLKEQIRFGDLDGPTALGRVLQAAVGRNGEIHLIQWNEPSIAVFDQQGRILRRIGRAGAGPGEFVRPSSLGFRGDSLWVSDPAVFRLTLFSPDGKAARTVSTSSIAAPSDYYLPYVPRSMFADGTVMAEAGSRAEFIQLGVVKDAPIVRVRGGRAETIAMMPITSIAVYVALPGVAIMEYRKPLPRLNFLRPLPDGSGIVIVTQTPQASPVYSVLRLAATGDTVFRRDIRYSRTPLGTAARDSIVDELAERMAKTRPIRVETLRKTISESMSAVHEYPPVTDVVAGTTGSIWIRREELASPTTTWDVLDADGRILGKCLVPREFRILNALPGSVLGTFDEKNGYPTVHQFRVEFTAR